MLLTMDVGNTEITGALFTGDTLAGHFRLTTVMQRTPDEWAATLAQHLAQLGRAPRDVKAIAIASVAPGVTEDLAGGLERATGITPVQVGPASRLPITLDVDEPLTVGADRVVNTLAAVELYRRDTIVVDFGTATTFDCITADTPPRFIGGAIAPGLVTAADNLVRRAAKLPATELSPPKRIAVMFV